MQAPQPAQHDPIPPLLGSVPELYKVYLEIAKRDHACRVRALYGSQTPPAGHSPFRPLPLKHFRERFDAAKALPGGEAAFRRLLARWANVHSLPADVVRPARSAA